MALLADSSVLIGATISLAVLACACEPPRIEDYDPGNVDFESSGGVTEPEMALAEVNGEVITLGDFERRLNSLGDPAQHRLRGTTARQGFLEALIAVEALAQVARQEGWAEDPAVEWAESQALTDVVLERVTQEEERTSATLRRTEIEAYYELNQHRFARPLLLWIAVIVVTDEARAAGIAGEYENRFATDIESSLTLFDELVAAESSELTQPGDLGFVTRAQLGEVASDELVDAVFALERVGELGGPIAVSGGFALVQLRQRREAFEKPLDEVEATIRDAVREARRRHARARRLGVWREEARIEVNEVLVGELEQARSQRSPPPQQPRWSNEPDFVLDERLTPQRDLTMVGGLLGDAPEPPDDSPSRGAEGE